jgi:hypothetical protein
MVGPDDSRRRVVYRLAATITVCLVSSLAMATPAVAETRPKGLPKVDLHATIACTGLEVSASRVFLIGQPPDPDVIFNVVTGFTRSKTRGAHKQAARIQATTGGAEYTVINDALSWCTSRGYTRRS